MNQPAQQQEFPGSEQQMIPKPDHGEKTYRGSGRLAGKVAVITGGDSGIGKAVAIAYAREGADVVVSYLSEHEDAQETCHYVEEAGRRAVPIFGDLADAAHCREVIQGAVDEFGRIDVLVSNAAFQMDHPTLEEVSDEEWDRTIAVNLSATMPPEKVESFGEQVPMGRPAQPAELAPVYVLLASDESSYVSGARIAVTGGKPIL